MEQGAYTGTPAVAEELRRLQGENERLREGIRKHRYTVQALARASTPSEHRLWALLDED